MFFHLCSGTKNPNSKFEHLFLPRSLVKMKNLNLGENEVLRLLCLHQNQVLKREDAVEQIYGEKDYFLGRGFYLSFQAVI